MGGGEKSSVSPPGRREARRSEAIVGVVLATCLAIDAERGNGREGEGEGGGRTFSDFVNGYLVEFNLLCLRA